MYNHSASNIINIIIEGNILLNILKIPITKHHVTDTRALCAEIFKNFQFNSCICSSVYGLNVRKKIALFQDNEIIM